MGVHWLTGKSFYLFYCYDDGKTHGIRYQQITFTIGIYSKWTSGTLAGDEHRVSPVALCRLNKWIK